MIVLVTSKRLFTISTIIKHRLMIECASILCSIYHFASKVETFQLFHRPACYFIRYELNYYHVTADYYNLTK